MIATATVAYGLFGKIPTKADFVHRDLPHAFVTPWDQWLREALAASRDAMGTAWMSRYLASPPWRFALDPGLAGPVGWIGLLVSSIDQVQRCYPLTLAVALPPSTPIAHLSGDFEPLLERLEDIALGLAGGERLVEEAMEALAPLATAIVGVAHSAPAVLRWSDRRATVAAEYSWTPTVSAMIAEARPHDQRNDLSCWWHRGFGGRAPARVVAEGMPPARGFAAFLDASWTSHGWIPDDGR